MSKVLITGAAGFIGSSLAERLLARGEAVVAIDNFDPYYDIAIKRQNISESLHHPHYSFYEMDICDEAALQSLFQRERPDVVVHLAARAGVRPSLADPNLYHRVNIIGSQHILDTIRRYPVSHLVWASSSSVYGGSTRVPFKEDDPVMTPISPYAATKRMNELMGHVYSHVYGLNVTMLRFFTVYGPRQRPDMAISKFTQIIDRGDTVPMFGDGSTRRDYTFIDDILDGLVRCVDTPFKYEIFNLGESKTITLAEMIEVIAKEVGKPANIKQMPLQPGDVEITYACVDKARALLGYDPKFSFEEGVRRYVKWYRACQPVET
jgi:UDP-glucuronate 4-epimerase